jgi:hypothetical protein
LVPCFPDFQPDLLLPDRHALPVPMDLHVLRFPLRELRFLQLLQLALDPGGSGLTLSDSRNQITLLLCSVLLWMAACCVMLSR